MTIFASNINSSQTQIIIQNTIQDNQVLIYSSTLGGFTNMNIGELGSVEGETLGNSQSITVYSGKVGNKLQFKRFEAGPGIVLEQDEERILVNANIPGELLSVPGSFNIVIDNDNDTPDAKFEIFTSTNLTPTEFEVVPTVVPPIISTSIYTGNESGNGYIRSVNDADFIAAGFEAGMAIYLSGTTDQDGLWEIKSVTNSTVGPNFISEILLEQEFIDEYGINLGGPKPATSIEQIATWLPDTWSIPPEYTDLTRLYGIKIYGVDFGPDGYNVLPGMQVTISGSTSQDIDGTYIIGQVFPKGGNPKDWSALLFTPSSPFPEGTIAGPVFDNNPFSPNITLTFKDYVETTGFAVNKDGNVQAHKYFALDNDINENHQLTTKEYVDNVLDDVVSQVEYDNLVDYVNDQIQAIQDQVSATLQGENKAVRFYWYKIRA